MWIARGTEPLPCKLVVTDLTDEARPQYSAELDWMLDPTFGDVVFEFTPPKDAAAHRDHDRRSGGESERVREAILCASFSQRSAAC